MDSGLSPVKNPKAAGSPYFKSLEPLLPAKSNAQNGDPTVPVGIPFYISILRGNKIIMFGKPDDQIKKSSSLWTFDLETLKWETMEVEGSSFLVENKTDYSVNPLGTSDIMLLGCTGTTNPGKKCFIFNHNTQPGVFTTATPIKESLNVCNSQILVCNFRFAT